MRRLHLVMVLFATASLLVSGCRQTTGSASTGPLAPAGTLAPVATGQTPSLSPFGGSTRVSPPSTGSYVAPSNYLGGNSYAPPIGQATAGSVPAGGFASQATGGVIGSGVRPAGWTETNSMVPGSPNGYGNMNGIAAPNSLGRSTFGTNPSSGQDPRSGGMQVIDMTGAPPPPGYRSIAPNYTGGYPATIQPGPSFQQGWQSNSPPPAFQNQPQADGFQNQTYPGGGNLRAIDPPNPAEFANSLTPINSAASVPRTAAAPPSTEPINRNNVENSQPSLPWRRPGTQY